MSCGDTREGFCQDRVHRHCKNLAHIEDSPVPGWLQRPFWHAFNVFDISLDYIIVSMGITGSPQIAVGVAALVLLTTYIFTKLYRARSLIWDRQKRGLPVAPRHSFFFGHLLYLKSMLDRLPPNAHYQNALGDIAREHFQGEGLYYIDLWPVSGILMVITSPHVANQIHANPLISMQRPALLPRFFRPFCGGPSMFDMREHEWKPWRSAFSKAFSAEHTLSLVPGMVDETMVYCESLQKRAEKKEFLYLDLITLRFTIDIIGKTILNAPLGAQKGYNVLADCMLSQVRWHQPNSEGNPFEYLNVARIFMHWWNGRQMDTYIGNELDKRYEEYKADQSGMRTKAIMDLVLQAFLAESKNQASTPSPARLDPQFRTFAISQIRLFVFVGHDSVSSTICYVLHLLSQHPTALSQIRNEHDEVLGRDIFKAPSLLKSQPNLTNDLPYTAAVIKESLRLFPPGGASRAGRPGVDLLDDTGKCCPTSNTAAVFTIHSELQRAPSYWKQPDAFLPERWLVGPDHDLYPLKGAYRAFEIGPRNCVAQGYVMTELRVILACVVRRFDFQPAYAEWDASYASQRLGNAPKTYRGERAYQIEEGAAHPAEHYPCRISVRS